MASERKNDVGVLALWSVKTFPPAEGEGEGEGCEACTGAALGALPPAEGAGEARAAREGVGEAERKLDDVRSSSEAEASGLGRRFGLQSIITAHGRVK